ncbi:MAG: NAD(P)-dependent oxidoreductase [Armatimonadota bacterium]
MTSTTRSAPPWRTLVVNGTFLEVLEEHRPAMEALGFTVLRPKDLGLGTTAEIIRASADVEVVFGPGIPYDAAFFENAGSLQVIAISASGYEGVDLEAATRAGVAVTNAPTQLGSAAVADLAFGLMLAVARSIPQCHSRITHAPTEERLVSRQPRPLGQFVWGKTLGILGLGAIGRELARRGKGFAMRVLAHDIHWDEEFARLHGITRVSLDTLLAESDFLSLHLRDTPSTRGIIGAAELARMKPTAYLINTARAALVDQAALYEALTTGRLAGAALDTAVDLPDNPLIDLPNVISTPHLGNRCAESVQDVMRATIEEAHAVLTGGEPRYLLNPDVLAGARASRP